MSEWVIRHHGIEGQKWGRRRYQNEDGSLTSAGASRYMDGDGGFRWGEHANEHSGSTSSSKPATASKEPSAKKRRKRSE